METNKKISALENVLIKKEQKLLNRNVAILDEYFEEVGISCPPEIISEFQTNRVLLQKIENLKKLNQLIN